jgi:hypothetical protein
MASPEYKPIKNVVAEENFCCGFKRCPVIRVYEDGSVDTTDGDQRIEYTPEQAKRLLVMLQKQITK